MSGEARRLWPAMRRGRPGEPDYAEELHPGPPDHRSERPASTISGLGSASDGVQRGGDGDLDATLEAIEAE